MSKTKKRQHRMRQATLQTTSNDARHYTLHSYPYIRWGIISLIGAAFLIVIQGIYVLKYLQSSSKQSDAIPRALESITAPLIIDAILLLLGLILLGYGLWLKRRAR